MEEKEKLDKRIIVFNEKSDFFEIVENENKAKLLGRFYFSITNSERIKHAKEKIKDWFYNEENLELYNKNMLVFDKLENKEIQNQKENYKYTNEDVISLKNINIKLYNKYNKKLNVRGINSIEIKYLNNTKNKQIIMFPGNYTKEIIANKNEEKEIEEYIENILKQCVIVPKKHR
jgi:hypothetical protein